MIRPHLSSFCLAALLLHSALPAQSLFLDDIGTGPAVTVTGGGGPPSSSVELFKNGISAGSFTTSAGGQFSIPNVASTSGDLFHVSAGQVWNFSANGNSEGWSVIGDNSVVSGGVWQITNSAGNDITVQQFTPAAIRSKFRGLEVRMRYSGGPAPGAGSIQVVSADGNTWILNSFNLPSGGSFQTFVFDLGTDAGGNPTAWLDPSAPVGMNIYIPGVGTNHVLEIDSIRLTESLNWEFNESGDFAEWGGTANTSLSNTGGGVLRLTSIGNDWVAATRPFRPIGSTHFVQMETRLRKVSVNFPNSLIQWNYISNPAAYNGGAIQFIGPASDGNFQVITGDLTTAPVFGNTWGAGGAATLNAFSGAFQCMFGSAGDFTEVDYIRLHPAVRYGPSATEEATGSPQPVSYYISFSEGNDLNSGRSAVSAWKTFANLNGLALGPGCTVYLKRGDTWANSKLTLAGKGTPASPITLTAYGEGNRPRITGINLTTEPCIVWNNPSHVRINSMDCRDAKIGIYLRFTGGNSDGTGDMFNNSGVHITNCYFKNMDELWSNPDGSITVQPPFELAWGAGIWFGGSIPGDATAQSQVSAILDDFSVTHCGFDQVNTGVGSNFYNSVIYRNRFSNFRFEDSWVTGCENGSFALTFVNGGHAKRVDTWIGGTGFYATGTTSGFIQHSANFLIDDCQFAGSIRPATSNDGVGFDIEGDCLNITIRNSVIHNNAGGAMLILNSGGFNNALLLENLTAWNNCRNPFPGSRGQNSEFRYAGSPAPPSPATYGNFNNSGVYLGSDMGTGDAAGFLTVYNDSSWWTRDFKPSGIRTSTSYATVAARPIAWGFTSSVEGWGSANQWTGFAASGGALVGTSSGADPFVQSPLTWSNTRERRWVLVRMSQTAGSTGQVFFETETSPGFAEAKSVAFPIIADGVMRDYVVDLGQSASYQGVITRWRLDPTNAAGSTMVIDRFDSMPNPYLATATPVASNIIDLRFNQAMNPDGGVFNPASYALSGLGQGTATSQPTSVSLISTATGPVYRLTWASGHTNGFGAVLSASGATDPRGNPLWTGSQLAITTIPKPEIDSDNDGMPDDWETANGLNPNNPADALLDNDGDGQNNLAEYLANTNPNDSSSRFHVTNIVDSPGNPGFLRITWASQPGMAYQVENSVTLAPDSWVPMHPDPLVATTAQTFWDAATFGDRRFYRVRAIRPNPLITVP